MAGVKKSFVLYHDQRGVFNKLSNEQAGILIKHIFAYANEEDPEADFITEIAFESIKNQMVRDSVKWEEIRQKRIDAGIASAEARKLKEQQDSTHVNTTQHMSTHVEFVEHTSANPTVNVNETVTVNDTVNDEENELLPKGNDPSSFAEKLNKAMNSIIPYLNEKAGTSFKANNKSTERLISARLKDGYGWYDFKAVIDGKTAEWKENKEMRAYLRPSTLFGTKFESYVQVVKAIPARRENPKGEDRNNSHGNIRFANPIL